MDDCDDGASSGISGWAGYCLGRIAERSARTHDELFDAWQARRQLPAPRTYLADEVHAVIAGWKREVQSLKDQLQVAYQERSDDQIERDELLAHNKVYGEESLAQLAYIRELTESREAALEGERLARVREDLQRIYVAELLEEIAELKAKG